MKRMTFIFSGKAKQAAQMPSDEALKIKLLDIFQERSAVENAMFLCEYRDTMLGQEQLQLSTLRAQLTNLFSRYLPEDSVSMRQSPIGASSSSLKPAVTLTVADKVYSTTTPKLNISASLENQIRNLDVRTADEPQLYGVLSALYKEVTTMVLPVLIEKKAMDVLKLFEKSKPTPTLLRQGRGRMTSVVVEANAPDDPITWARPVNKPS